MSNICYMSAISAIAPAVSRFASFQDCLPLKVASAQPGRGAFIGLDFGDEQSRDLVTGEVQYDWHLWVYMCDWDLYKGDSRILWRRESNNSLAGAVLGQLKGESLLAIEQDETDDCFILKFSGGFRLNIDPDFFDFEEDNDLFMLFKYGEDDCLSFSPKRSFYRAA